MGVQGDWKQSIDEAKARGEIEDYVVDPTLAVPDSFDAAENWPQCADMINDIRDQSACGCCWAFAGAEAASDRQCSMRLEVELTDRACLLTRPRLEFDSRAVATNASTKVPLSAQDLCFCGFQIFSHGCNGGQINTPWDHIKRIGAVSGGQVSASRASDFAASDIDLGRPPHAPSLLTPRSSRVIQFNNTGPTFGQSSFCSDFSLPHCHHRGSAWPRPLDLLSFCGCRFGSSRSSSRIACLRHVLAHELAGSSLFCADGPQGADPYPDEKTPGCPNAQSPKCPNQCDAGTGKTWKADKYSFTGKVQSASGEQAIQQMLMTGGPVSTAFTVYSDFEDYAGGIYHHTTGSMAGGHAVKFVGWGVENGKKYWKVANSWNPFWGEKATRTGAEICHVSPLAVLLRLCCYPYTLSPDKHPPQSHPTPTPPLTPTAGLLPHRPRRLPR